MPNSLITPTLIAKEALMQLENNLVMGSLVHREYKSEFSGGQGASVQIRKPVKFEASNGATRVNQDVTESFTNITIDQRKHVSWKFATQDLTLSVEEYSERYIKPAAIALAQQVETSLTGLYSSVSQNVGTPGTPPATFLDMGAARRRLVEAAAPAGVTINAIIDPAAALSIANDLKAVTVNNNKVLTALEQVRVGKYAGMELYEAQSLRVHQGGVIGGAAQVNGADQFLLDAAVTTANLSANAQTLVLESASNSITNWARAGDVFTIANVFAINPVTRQSTGRLMEFVVNANANSSAGGAVTLNISPQIIATGRYQNVSAGPANDALITWKTTTNQNSVQNLCFQKNAFALVTVPLEMPDGAAFKARESHKGLSMRCVKDYDIDADEDIIRLDILNGVKTIYPELAVRLFG